MNIKNIKVPYESLLLIQLVIYMYSYNFHFLWLICDAIIVFNFCYAILRNLIRRIPLFLVSFLLIVLYFFNSNSQHGFHLISLFSFWDTYKHIFLFLFSFDLFNKISLERKEIFINRLLTLSCVTFFLEVVIVFYQKKIGLPFDNIAGTLGDGSTHALAYFSIFILVFLIIHKKSILLTLIVFTLSIIINFFAENVGFYLLLGLALLFVLSSRLSKVKMIMLSIIVGLILFVGISKLNFADQYLGRISAFSVTESYSGSSNLKAERGVLMGYSVYLGGIYGQGFGAYSEIYGMEGWLFYKLIIDQLCISEATHLVAEIGIVGFLLTLITYIILISVSIKNRPLKLFSIAFFLLGMFYNRFLIDERIFFFFVLTILIWKLHTDREFDNNKINHV